MKKTYFQAGTCNTICDITGFQVKLSQTVTTWNKLQVIPSANSQRHPQDFPPKIIPTKVHANSRTEQYYDNTVIAAPTPV